jgi:ParB family chromosome partitioning protein
MTDIVSLDDYRAPSVLSMTVESFVRETDEQLDEMIGNGESIERGVGGMTRLRRVQRGGRLKAVPTGGAGGGALLPGSSALSQTEQNKRSEERVAYIAYQRGELTDADIREMGWKKVVAKARGARVSHNTGVYEWYTPPAYIEAARYAMGSIDLDPASCDVANETVRAATYYTQEQDGLAQDWFGNVWMNPPYSSKLITSFIGKLCGHIDTGDVEQAVVLVNNATETQWFRDLAIRVDAICLPTGRVRFMDADGDKGSPLQGQAVLYAGNHVQRFQEAFSPMGTTWQ